MVRRKKMALAPDLTIMPQEENRIASEFTEPEKALYDYLERLLYRQLVKSRDSTSMAYNRLSISTTFVSYLRLKQVCSHRQIILDKFPDLVPLVEAGSIDDVILSDLEKSDSLGERRSYEEALDIIESY